MSDFLILALAILVLAAPVSVAAVWVYSKMGLLDTRAEVAARKQEPRT